MPYLTLKRSRKAARGSDENPYWMSFSDIMAGLLVIFILACVILLLQLMEIKDRVQIDIVDLHKADQVRRELVNEIAERLLDKGVQVEVSDNHTVLRIPDHQLYFKTNSAVIQREHTAAVNDIGEVLYNTIRSPERLKYIDTIFIEGHTDSRRARRFKDGNWGLSASRAIAIWRFWTERAPYGHDLKDLRNKDEHPLFSVSGYAASRPLVKNEQTAEQRKKNRRIDIRFTTRRPSIESYEGVLDVLSGNR